MKEKGHFGDQGVDGPRNRVWGRGLGSLESAG
jgi:hypothetical protein